MRSEYTAYKRIRKPARIGLTHSTKQNVKKIIVLKSIDRYTCVTTVLHRHMKDVVFHAKTCVWTLNAPSLFPRARSVSNKSCIKQQSKRQ